MSNEATLLKNTEQDGYSPLPKNADAFVRVPTELELLDFGKITEDLAAVAGIRPLPIRLVNGRHFGSGGGYGIAHIAYHHAAALALLDYYSIQDFVDEVVSGFTALYAGDGGRQLIVRRKDKDIRLDRLLVLELAPSKDHYSVVTGWLVSSRRRVRGVLVAEKIEKDGAMVWECRAPHSKGPGGSDPTLKAG